MARSRANEISLIFWQSKCPEGVAENGFHLQNPFRKASMELKAMRRSRH